MKSYTFYDARHKAREIKITEKPVFDTHTHLLMLKETTPADALVEAARTNVCAMAMPIDPCEEGNDPLKVFEALEQAQREAEEKLKPEEKVPAVSILAGVHPYHSQTFYENQEDTWERINAYSRHPYFVGVGEIGLDYTCDVDKNVQREMFEQQLDYAIRNEYPVELHIRCPKGDPEKVAHKDALDVLKQVGVPKAGCVYHCFTEDAHTSADFIREHEHVYIALGGIFTFKNGDLTRYAAYLLPPEKILIETDAPYLAPMSLRGTECTPAMAAINATCVAHWLVMSHLMHGDLDRNMEDDALNALANDYLETFWRNSQFLMPRTL